MEPNSKEKFHETLKTYEYYAYSVKSNCQKVKRYLQRKRSKNIISIKIISIMLNHLVIISVF